MQTLIILLLALNFPGLASAGEWTTERLAFNASYPEGPLVQKDRVLFVDYAGNSVRQIRDGTASELWQSAGCGPAGQVALPSGNLLVTCYDRGSLVELSSDGVEISEITVDDGGRALPGPNDLTVDSAGGVYFSASGVFDVGAPVAGKIYYLTPDRQVRLLAKDIHYANGLALAPDQKTLYVNEHLAARVLRFPVTEPGVLGERFVLARLPALPGGSAVDPYRGPDGLKVAASGRLLVCEFGGGRVLVLDLNGQLVDQIDVPVAYVTNVAEGTRGELYITATSDAWHAPYPGGVYVATPTTSSNKSQ